jgi:hypothetical protein
MRVPAQGAWYWLLEVARVLVPVPLPEQARVW